MSAASLSAHLKHFPPKGTSILSFIKIGQKLWKLAHCINLLGGRVVGVVELVGAVRFFSIGSFPKQLVMIKHHLKFQLNISTRLGWGRLIRNAG